MINTLIFIKRNEVRTFVKKKYSVQITVIRDTNRHGNDNNLIRVGYITGLVWAIAPPSSSAHVSTSATSTIMPMLDECASTSWLCLALAPEQLVAIM
jgi:hypothetical protein